MSSSYYSTIGSSVSTVANTYLQVQEAHRLRDLEQKRIKRNQRLTAEMITITHNSTLAKSTEVAKQAARDQLKILREERSAEGRAIVNAAQAGAEGQRVALARSQAIEGKAADAMTELGIALETAQEDLIDQARFMTRRHMHDLISGSAPQDHGLSPAEIGLGATSSVLSGYLQDRSYNEQRKENLAQLATQ